MLASDQTLLSEQVDYEKLRNQGILLTGATGFFGLNFLEAISYLNSQHQLCMSFTVLVRNIPKAKELFDSYEIPCDSLHFIETDLVTLDPHSLEVPNFDSVFHFAANANLELLRNQPELERKLIIQGTQNTLELAKKSHCKSFVFLSSGAVYGKQPSSISQLSESDTNRLAPSPDDVYGTAKVIAERLCRDFCLENKIAASLFRGFAFAGPHLKLDAHYAIGNFLAQALQGKAIVVKEGTTLRSYLYIIDAVIWILQASIKNQDIQTYNLGSDQAIALESLAQKISKLCGSPEVIVQSRPSTPSVYIPNIDAIRNDLGVKIYTPLEKTLQHMIEWNQWNLN